MASSTPGPTGALITPGPPPTPRSSGADNLWQKIGRLFKRFEEAKVDEKALVRQIIDKVFERFTSTAIGDTLGAQELYTAILLVYNDINKNFPGPHHDPPSKPEVDELLKTFDANRNGVLDRAEFTDFVQQFTTNVTKQISINVVIFALVAPGLAILTKGATERMPVVGNVVKKTPNAVYASLISALIALTAKISDKC
eukprot:TRINITY_DN11847_c0_g1_i2.p1 TRINITY_DN11847_c0_g1~~TRINITY_DN11847_c0_g1_i2.p1  ORF type:complete len:198 (-),score=27.69 TRINITY_DN11847_c0_g1_i2:1141-1734(-)